MKLFIKKPFFILLFLVLLCHAKGRGEWDGAFRMGAFFPTSSEVRQVYRNVWRSYQLEAAYTFDHPWRIWANMSYLIVDGRHIDTRLQLYPVGLGLDYTYLFPYCIQGYLGGGTTFNFLRIEHFVVKNNHTHTDFKRSKKNLGCVIRTGLKYYTHEATFIELFVNYSYSPFNLNQTNHLFDKNHLNLSAFVIGGGIGVSF
jgi:hypothetical protein